MRRSGRTRGVIYGAQGNVSTREWCLCPSVLTKWAQRNSNFAFESCSISILKFKLKLFVVFESQDTSNDWAGCYRYLHVRRPNFGPKSTLIQFFNSVLTLDYTTSNASSPGDDHDRAGHGLDDVDSNTVV